jgi:hypothetical protein
MSVFGLVQRDAARRQAARAAPSAEREPTAGELAFPDFCASLSIRLKDGSLRSFAPANWYEEQTRFEAQRTGRDVTLKDRQIGFTTLELARDLHYCLANECLSNVLIVVHDGTIADQLFITLRLFASQLKAQRKLPPTLYSNKRELVFRAGGAVRIVEAGNTEETADARGRSGTIHRLHLTELAFYKADHETLAALMSCVPEDGEVSIESTPNGPTGKFHEHCMKARAGTSGYRFHFFGWLDHREYRKRVPPRFDPKPRDEHEEAARAAGADDEQIAWWRAKVDDPSIGLHKALREFPLDPDTCFAFRDLSKAVIPEFDRRVHVAPVPRPEFAHCYVGADPGQRDLFGIVWGYWETGVGPLGEVEGRARLMIQRDWCANNATTATLAQVMKDMERELWTGVTYWDGQALRPNPYLRTSDVDPRLVGDLSADYGITVGTHDKSDDKAARLFSLRNAFTEGRIQIDPCCVDLIAHLEAATWNDGPNGRRDYKRKAGFGHFDLLDALEVLWRSVNRTLASRPPSWILDPSLQVPAPVRALAERRGSTAALGRALGGKKPWQR